MPVQSPADGTFGGRQVVSIRPAVPLIFESRLKIRGGGKVSDDGKSVSVASAKSEGNEGGKEAEVLTPAIDAQEQPLEGPGSQLTSKEHPRSLEALSDFSVDLRAAKSYEAKHMKQDRLKILEYMAEDPTEGNGQLQEENAVSYEDSEKYPTVRSAHRLNLGVEVEQNVPSMKQEDQEAQATRSQRSSTGGKTSSEGVSETPISSAETSVGMTRTSLPITYSAPYVQFGSYVNSMPPPQPYANPYTVPQYDPQAQYRFMQPWNGVPQFHPLGGQPPPTPSSASLDDGNTLFDSKLAGHISSNFNVERYADIRLIVTHELGRFKPATFFLHRVLASRSETLRGLLDEYAGNYDVEDGKLVVKMKIDDRFVTPTALAAALQTCYGQPASNFLHKKSLSRADCTDNQSVAVMLEILAFAATGHLLKLEDVALRGIERAQEALNWDNLQCAFSFGMEACTHRRESPEALLLKHFSYSTPEGDMFSVDCTSYMLDLCLSFMAASIPDSWNLDRSVSGFPIVDRLPAIGQSSKPCTKSKLAHIQFGQFPQVVDPKVADRDALISRILLALPFSALCHIAARTSSLVSQLPQIIEERERRRFATLNSEVHWNDRRLGKETTWHAVSFQESYTPTDPHNGALGLNRIPVSIHRTPADEEDAQNQDQADQGLVQNS